MSSVNDIEQAIRPLRAWFAEFDAERWDSQFEDDVKAGRLDAFANEALKDLKEGRCTDL